MPNSEYHSHSVTQTSEQGWYKGAPRALSNCRDWTYKSISKLWHVTLIQLTLQRLSSCLFMGIVKDSTTRNWPNQQRVNAYIHGMFLRDNLLELNLLRRHFPLCVCVCHHVRAKQIYASSSLSFPKTEGTFVAIFGFLLMLPTGAYNKFIEMVLSLNRWVDLHN